MIELPALAKGRIDIEPVDQNEPPAPHAGDPLPAQPRPTGILRREAQFLGEFADGTPTSELSRAMRRVERAQRLLRLRVARLKGLLAAHDATDSG